MYVTDGHTLSGSDFSPWCCHRYNLSTHLEPRGCTKSQISSQACKFETSSKMRRDLLATLLKQHANAERRRARFTKSRTASTSSSIRSGSCGRASSVSSDSSALLRIGSMSSTDVGAIRRESTGSGSDIEAVRRRSSASTRRRDQIAQLQTSRRESTRRSSGPSLGPTDEATDEAPPIPPRVPSISDNTSTRGSDGDGDPPPRPPKNTSLA